MWTASRIEKPDASGIRFAELYARALDRLGEASLPLRVGALRTLEVLGQDHPAHRQAIVDVFCAYLRTPAGEDGRVRVAAERILAGHLYPRGPGFWGGVGLDLTAATLIDFDLSGCRIDGSLRLDFAVFLGPAKFRGMVARGQTSLHGATFHDHAWFERSVLAETRLDRTTFLGDAWFGEAIFAGRTTFAGADFGGHAWFGGCHFHGQVDFNEAVFRRSAGFRGAVADVGVGLVGTTFVGPARVSLRDETWNITAPGWRIVVDPDNEAVGQLLWVGFPELIARPDQHIGRQVALDEPRTEAHGEYQIEPQTVP